jgi:hypothetical protein
LLVCRELDSNYDGVMDVVRQYDEEGKRKAEWVDADYDGHVDTWVTFSGGRVSTLAIDSNHDGKADEKRFFVEGRLARIQQDKNADGRADHFEIYREGRLERIGIDADFDGRVDRWERDASLALDEETEDGQGQAQQSSTPGEESAFSDRPGEAGARDERPTQTGEQPPKASENQ